MSAGAARRPARGASAAGRIYVTDCEGPLTRNDNAQEIAERFIPDGAEFFARLSKYDDFLVDVAAKPGYNAGDTLRLIPPFFKAFYVTDEDVESFSAEQVLLVPEALKTLDAVSALMPAFIISTSYTPYLQRAVRPRRVPVRARALHRAQPRRLGDARGRGGVAARVGAARVRAAGHRVPGGGDDGRRGPRRRRRGRGLRRAGRHAVAQPRAALEWLSDEDQATVARAGRLFWARDPERPRERRLLAESVHPVGGGQKLAALEEIVAAEGVEGGGVMYVGDSITDTPPLAAVKAWGGVSLSFNGNGYAIAAAEFAAASPDAEVQAQLARGVRGGRPGRRRGRRPRLAQAQEGHAPARQGARHRGRRRRGAREARRGLRRRAAERPRRAGRAPRLTRPRA